MSGECFNYSLPFQQVLLDQRMSLLHGCSRDFLPAVFLLDLWLGETAHEPFMRGISISYTTLGPPDISPVGFLSQMFGGHLSDADLRSWGAFPRTPTLTSLGEAADW